MDDEPMPMEGSPEPGLRAGGSADVFRPSPHLTTGQLWIGLAFYLFVGMVILAYGLLLSSSALRWPLVVVGALVLVVHLVRYGRFMVRH